MQNRERTLSRDVVATQIRSGDKHTLSAGEVVSIHQILGGSYTVQSSTGLYSITGADADALGDKVVTETITLPPPPTAPPILSPFGIS